MWRKEGEGGGKMRKATTSESITRETKCAALEVENMAQ